MNIDSLDLNLLRIFLAVYRARSVSRAALDLGLTQPAVSNAMTRLRKQIGDPLFVPTSKGMEPTVVADDVAPAVATALSLVQQAVERPARFEPGKSQRTFRLLMSDVGEVSILPDVFNALQFTAPGVCIESIRLPHSEYAEALSAGSADLAIGNLPFLKTNQFFQQRLFSEPYLVISRPHHPIVRKGRISLDEFIGARHVTVAGGNADALVDAALGKMKLKRQVCARLGSHQAAALVVSQTDWLATFPLRAIPASVRSSELPISLATAEVRQFWHRRAHRDAGSQWLRTVLAETFAS